MGGLFSKEKNSKNSNSSVNQNSKVTDKDKAVLDLKNARDRLKKYRKKVLIYRIILSITMEIMSNEIFNLIYFYVILYQVEKDSEQLTEQAKVFINKQQKDRALIILKLRRLRENEVNKIDSELMSILEMINNIEWEYANMEVIKALKVGNAALNKLHQEMSIDDVIDILEEVNDEIDVENKINQVLASQFDFMIDNNELEKELEELMNGNGKYYNYLISYMSTFCHDYFISLIFVIIIKLLYNSYYRYKRFSRF